MCIDLAHEGCSTDRASEESDARTEVGEAGDTRAPAVDAGEESGEGSKEEVEIAVDTVENDTSVRLGWGLKRIYPHCHVEGKHKADQTPC